VLDWKIQSGDFERDGSLRDIYVQSTTLDDWKALLGLLPKRNYPARLLRSGVAVAVPADVRSLFDGADRPLLTFLIANIELDCHFFTPGEIELSFAPDGMTEATLRALLAFMIDIGEATGKAVLMTPENAPETPIFTYEQRQLTWTGPQDTGH
jgi:hypothetical protein